MPKIKTKNELQEEVRRRRAAKLLDIIAAHGEIDVTDLIAKSGYSYHSVMGAMKYNRPHVWTVQCGYRTAYRLKNG